METTSVVIGLTAGQSVGLLGQRLSLMCDEGLRVHICVGNRAGMPADLDSRVSVHVVPMTRSLTPLRDFIALWHWIRLIRRLHPDILILATPKVALLGGLAGKFLHVPRRILELWGLRWDGLPGLRGWLLRSSDKLALWACTESIAVSPSLACYVVEAGVARAAPRVLANWGSKGVDLEMFRPSFHSGMSQPPTIGYAGRIAADKGINFLPRIFQGVQKQIPHLTLKIAGEIDLADPPDPAIGPWLNSRDVACWGFVKDMSGFLQTLDVLVFPSLREGMPNAVIESAACGIPVVGWQATGTSDAIIHGETGYLVSYGDLEDFCAKVILLLTNHGLRQRMGYSARRLAEERFNSRHVQGSWLRLLRDA